MEKSVGVDVEAFEQEIIWTVSFLRDLQNRQHKDAATVQTVQLLIERMSLIAPSTRELFPS